MKTTKTNFLIILMAGIGLVGFGIYFTSSPDYIENHSPGYPRSSEIPA